MDISETTLDDVFASAQRLETRNRFIVPLSNDNILQSTRHVFESFHFSEQDLISGQQLLAEHQADLAHAGSILKSINTNRMLTDELFSFQELTTAAFQSAIVSSIQSTQDYTDRLNENFLFKTLGQRNHENEVRLHRTLNLENSLLTSSLNRGSKNLLPKQNFYASLTSTFFHKDSHDYAALLSKSVLEEPLFTHSLRYPLSDTFYLIHSLMVSPDHDSGVISFLEYQMHHIIISEVNSNLRIAERGGEIGLLPTLKSYVKLVNHPFSKSQWAVIYYALRCGAPEIAYKYALEERDFDRDVISALEMRSNKIAPISTIVDSLTSYYRREITSKTLDPFKALSLSVLCHEGGFFDPTIITSIEDWLWLRLNISSITDEAELHEISESCKTEQPSNPFLPGQVLLMIGMHDEAIKWFLSSLTNIDDNLHIAIACHVAGLTSSQNIAPSLLSYVKEELLPSNDPQAGDWGLMYIKLIQDPEIRKITTAQLVVEAENDQGINLFKSIDERKAPAALAFTPDEQHQSLLAACELAENRDQSEKAIQLYILADNFVKVAELSCRNLARVIAGFATYRVSMRPQTEDYQLRSIGDRYNDSIHATIKNAKISFHEIQNSNKEVPTEIMECFRHLLFLAAAANHVRKQEWVEAVDDIEKAGIFPSSMHDITESRQKIASSKEVLKRVIPQAIEIAMRAYTAVYKSLPKTNRKIMITEKAMALNDLVGLVNINIEINEDLQNTILSLLQEFQ